MSTCKTQLAYVWIFYDTNKVYIKTCLHKDAKFIWIILGTLFKVFPTSFVSSPLNGFTKILVHLGATSIVPAGQKEVWKSKAANRNERISNKKEYVTKISKDEKIDICCLQEKDIDPTFPTDLLRTNVSYLSIWIDSKLVYMDSS